MSNSPKCGDCGYAYDEPSDDGCYKHPSKPVVRISRPMKECPECFSYYHERWCAKND